MQRFSVTSADDIADLNAIAEIVARGGVIAYPTDTVYGLGCDPLSEEAIEKVYALKAREKDQPLIILLDSALRLEQWVSDPPEFSSPLIAAWPAPLTIIFRVRPDVPEFLTRGGGTLAFRVPDSNLCRGLIAACGRALTSTSANRSGQMPLNNAEDIAAEFGGEINALLEAPLTPNVPSTLVSVTAGGVEVLRRGAFDIERVRGLTTPEK